ncbi:hypothetical protein E8E11_006444 [Didymella keratinophila]|nr:hypothetical protein E8E11_006444 [Didymella keratinophila]
MSPSTSSHNTSATSTPASTPPQNVPNTREIDPYAVWKEQMRSAHEARILSTSAMIEANYGKPAALQ